MRPFSWVTLLLVGCHAAAPVAPAGGLDVRVQLSTATPSSGVAIASAQLQLSALTAVSDRASHDARAGASDVELMLGGERDVPLPSAPPGLYSAVDAMLGHFQNVGLDVQAVWRSVRVHASLANVPFSVGCPTPVQLAPGRHARLTLRADPSGWFDGLDLTTVKSDPDDAGINISADDNRDLATLLEANVIASFVLDCAAQ